MSPARALIQCLQVIGEKLLNQLNHAIAMVSLRCIIRLLFERREGIGDGHRALAQRQERMIILRIADANDIVQGNLHLA